MSREGFGCPGAAWSAFVWGHQGAGCSVGTWERAGSPCGGPACGCSRRPDRPTRASASALDSSLRAIQQPWSSGLSGCRVPGVGGVHYGPTQPPREMSGWPLGLGSTHAVGRSPPESAAQRQSGTGRYLILRPLWGDLRGSLPRLCSSPRRSPGRCSPGRVPPLSEPRPHSCGALGVPPRSGRSGGVV